MIFLTETKCKIRFIYVGFNCKRKKVGWKNVWKFVPLRGGGSTPNGKNHLKFPFWLFENVPKLGLSLCMFYTKKSFQVHISIHFKITTKVINLSLARPPRLSPMSPKAWPRFTPLPSNLHRILTEFIAQWILTVYRSMNINRISLNEFHNVKRIKSEKEGP